MPPLETTVPVSASGEYVDENGDIVKDTDYEILTPFQIERTFEVPRHSQGEAQLELAPELERIVARAKGNAITDLRIEAVEYDRGSHGSAAGWKVFGWTMTLTGGALLATGAAVGGDVGDVFYPIGGVIAGLGVVSFLLSATANDPAKWQLKVSGQVVRRHQPASSPQPVDPASRQEAVDPHSEKPLGTDGEPAPADL